MSKQEMMAMGISAEEADQIIANRKRNEEENDLFALRRDSSLKHRPANIRTTRTK